MPSGPSTGALLGIGLSPDAVKVNQRLPVRVTTRFCLWETTYGPL